MTQRRKHRCGRGTPGGGIALCAFCGAPLSAGGGPIDDVRIDRDGELLLLGTAHLRCIEFVAERYGDEAESA